MKQLTEHFEAKQSNEPDNAKVLKSLRQILAYQLASFLKCGDLLVSSSNPICVSQRKFFLKQATEDVTSIIGLLPTNEGTTVVVNYSTPMLAYFSYKGDLTKY